MDRKLKRQYTFGIFLALIVLIINQIFIQYWLFKKDEDALTINISGRQRMLSQKIMLEFERYSNGKTKLSSIDNLYQTWSQTHFGLLNGDAELDILKVSDPTAVKYLEKISTNILFVKTFLERPSSSTEISRQTLYDNQARFLEGMEVVVNRLEQISNNKLHFIAVMEIVLAVLSAIILVMEVRYIYRPISQSLVDHIRKLKESQYKFKALFESTTDYNLILDRNFTIIAFNNVAKRVVKVVFNKELRIGQSVLEYSIDKYRDSFSDNLKKAAKGKVVRKEIEVPMPNNTSTWMDVTYSPIYDQFGEVIGISFNTTNIDMQKKVTLKLQAQNKKLRKIAWRQSHEVRGPVATIAGLCTLLKERDEDYLHYLSCLEIAINELDDVISTIVKETVEAE